MKRINFAGETMERKNMNKASQGGFTLIELIAVIVILGILAAVAVPKFFDLQEEAKVAALEGFAGGLKSAAAMNYAACLVGNTSCVDTGFDTCNDALVNSLMLDWDDDNISLSTGSPQNVFDILTNNATTLSCTASYN